MKVSENRLWEFFASSTWHMYSSFLLSFLFLKFNTNWKKLKNLVAKILNFFTSWNGTISALPVCYQHNTIYIYYVWNGLTEVQKQTIKRPRDQETKRPRDQETKRAKTREIKCDLRQKWPRDCCEIWNCSQGKHITYSRSNKKSGRNLWPSEIFSVVRDSPYWNIFKSKKIIVWEKKFRSLHPREQKKLVGVFTFFNGALEKKLEWCDQKNRIRSADGSIWQNANKKNMCTLE